MFVISVCGSMWLLLLLMWLASASAVAVIDSRSDLRRLIWGPSVLFKI